jgi:UPF0271 protein
MKRKSYPIDLNCDLGEGEPIERTCALMRVITSANVACGGHAGDLRSMMACVDLSRRYHVKVGAHPGFADRANFGRKVAKITSDDLELLLLQQVSALEKICKRRGVRLHHIKLHGGLYHAVENNETLARGYLQIVRRYWPGTRVCARYAGAVRAVARGTGVQIWREAFADRAYRNDGTLVPRDRPEAVFRTTERVIAQVKAILFCNFVISTGGKRVPIAAETLCLHSDTPSAIHLAKEIARVLREDDGR